MYLYSYMVLHLFLVGNYLIHLLPFATTYLVEFRWESACPSTPRVEAAVTAVCGGARYLIGT